MRFWKGGVPEAPFWFRRLIEGQLIPYYLRANQIQESISLSRKQKVGAKEAESPCIDCEYRSECKAPCDKLIGLLPGITAGRGAKENTTGLYVETLKDCEQTRRLEIFKQYQFCDAPFTDKQWNVICRYYEQGLSQDQIALATGRKRSAISGLLKRARDLKKRRFEQMREELFKLRKGTDA